MTRIFCGVVGFVLLVASAAGADQGAGTADATGSHLAISPTSEIIAFWPVGGGRLTLFGVEKGKTIGHIDPHFAFSTIAFSISGRFVCLGTDVPGYRIAVYDMRTLRKVIDTSQANGYLPRCQVEGDVRTVDPSTVGTRVANTVVIKREHSYGGPCPVLPLFDDSTFEYWDAGLKHPKIYKQYTFNEKVC